MEAIKNFVNEEGTKCTFSTLLANDNTTNIVIELNPGVDITVRTGWGDPIVLPLTGGEFEDDKTLDPFFDDFDPRDEIFGEGADASIVNLQLKVSCSLDWYNIHVLDLDLSTGAYTFRHANDSDISDIVSTGVLTELPLTVK